MKFEIFFFFQLYKIKLLGKKLSTTEPDFHKRKKKKKKFWGSTRGETREPSHPHLMVLPPRPGEQVVLIEFWFNLAEFRSN